MRLERWKMFCAAAMGAIAILSAGCITAPVVPPMGALYSKIEAPLDLNSAGGKVIGERRGESSSIAILGLVAFGDAGLKAAAEEGGLTTINHVDYKLKNVLFGAYAKYTTVAYGE